MSDVDEKVDICFLGDRSGISFAARNAAVVLKRGEVVVASENPEPYAVVEQLRDEVEESLNADFLHLHLDTEAEVAWAEPADGVPERAEQLFVARYPQRNDGALYIALSEALALRRQSGAGEGAALVVAEERLRERWEELLPDLAAVGDPGKRNSAWETSLTFAENRKWIKESGEKGMRVFRMTTVLDALEAVGFCRQWADAVEQSESE